ncbi:MAG: DNA-binding response regulator [Gammaproteobacteria bacterium]|nr:MAG: DNA-binding response regulator [Gammaproteobacteria bacterium]
MKILIVDDEPLARARLRGLLAETEAQVVDEAEDGRQALLKYNEHQPDVVLMDIRMPGMDGLEAARHLSGLEQPPAVIFTTAYDDHALDAFEAGAVDYLLKPVRAERLRAALAKSRQPNRAQLERLRQNAGMPHARTHLSVHAHGKISLIPVDEIRYFRADQKYVTAAYAGGEVLIEEPLKSLEQEFGARFLRVHRNALVACAFVAGMEKGARDSWHIRLRGTEELIEISRRHASEVRRKLHDLP